VSDVLAGGEHVVSRGRGDLLGSRAS
jgi:hypothetical protein